MSKVKHLKSCKNNCFKTLIIILVILLLSPCIIITAASINGQGITLDSIKATMETAKVMNNIKNKNFKKTIKYIGFWTPCTNKNECKSKGRVNDENCFINDLEEFFDDKKELVEFASIFYRTDDYFTSGTVDLMISDDGNYYSVGLNIVKQNGKLYPMNINYISANHNNQDEINQFAEDFIKVMNTYNPE